MSGTTFFAIVIVGLMLMVLVSLVRGLIAFMQSWHKAVDEAREGGATELQLKQNRMMMARIKYQALAIVAVALVLAFMRN